MKTVQAYISAVSDWLWGYPLIFLFLGAGVYLTCLLRFLPFRHAGLVWKKTIGAMFHKQAEQEAGISPFQAFTSALSATAGATNLVGVPVAIAFGGPGAIFWMWAVAFIGMSTIYTEIVLGLQYREKGAAGKWLGGPNFYLAKGLGWRKIGKLYSIGLLLVIIPSSMVQSNSVSTVLEKEFHLNSYITGVVIMLLTALLVLGGIERIGKVSSKLLPLFVIAYVCLTVYIIIQHIHKLDDTLLLIVKEAFTPTAAVGAFAGASVVQGMRWGVARGLYTSEAGMGTSAIAHANANGKEPSEQAFWGIFAVFLDTIVICTLTGITVVITGAWTKLGKKEASSMIVEAFTSSYGQSFSAIALSVMLIFFVIATVGVIIYYGELQAELLSGHKLKLCMRVIYLLAIIAGAAGGLEVVWELLDLILAVIVIPNVIGIVLLGRKVKHITDDYLERVKRTKKELSVK